VPISPDNPTQESVLDVTAQQIARVYAKALLGASDKVGNLDGVVEELDSLVDDVLSKQPQFGRMLASVTVASDEKERLLDRVFAGKASPQLLSFLKVLSRHGRLELLKDIRRELHELYNEHRNLVDVDVRAATQLDNALMQQIHDVLNHRLEATPVINVTVDPSLIGGLVIRVGDTVYDGSVATRFARVQAAMVEHAVEMIQTQRDKLLAD